MPQFVWVLLFQEYNVPGDFFQAVAFTRDKLLWKLKQERPSASLVRENDDEAVFSTTGTENDDVWVIRREVLSA